MSPIRESPIREGYDPLGELAQELLLASMVEPPESEAWTKLVTHWLRHVSDAQQHAMLQHAELVACAARAGGELFLSHEELSSINGLLMTHAPEDDPQGYRITVRSPDRAQA